MRLLMTLTGLLAAILLAPLATLHAHDFWIEPSQFRPEAGERVTLTLRVGEDFSGDSQPLIPNWFDDYSVRSPAGTQPVRGRIGDDPAGYFIAGDAGSQVVGYRSTRSFVEIDPVTFDNYLVTEGLDWVRERSGEGFDAVLGYTLELIPLRDPYILAPGAAMPVELRYQDEPIEGLLVIAFTAEDPQQKQQMRTDRNGRAVLQLQRPGTWLVKAVHIIELDDREPDADWESYWASLTFRLAGVPEAAKLTDGS